MSNRNIEIIIDVRDNTNNKVKGLADDFMAQIRSNAKEISDLMAGCLAEAVSDIHQNQSLTA